MTEGEPRYRWRRRRAVAVWFSALAHIRLRIYFFSIQEEGGLHGSRGELLEDAAGSVDIADNEGADRATRSPCRHVHAFRCNLNARDHRR